MLSSPPPAAALSTVSNKSGGDLSATAITPGGPVTSNGHHGPHHPGEMSPSAPAIGTTPIEVTISGSTSPGSSVTGSSSSNGGQECLCVGCQRPIRDRYLMCVSERYWHEACLHCTVCRIILTNSCYVKERKVYCKSDYNKLYSAKCSNCLESIGPDELVMRAQGHVYHVSCFICIWCKRQLRKGDKFAMRGNQPVCELDLVKEGTLLSPYNDHGLHSSAVMAGGKAPTELSYDLVNGQSMAGRLSPPLELTILQPPQTPQEHSGRQDPYSPRTLSSICDSNGHAIGSLKSEPYSSPSHGTVMASQPVPPSGGTNQMTGNNSAGPSPNANQPAVKQDGRRGPKRPRTILTTAQRRAFKASFEISQKPCRKVRETLAKETGLSVRIVQVWFQNQRAKLKKIQRKQQQQQLAQGGTMVLSNGGSESGGGIGSSDKSKDDTTDEEDDESAHFSLPYMIQSPDAGSYYSARGDEDGFTVKSEIGGMDDSETSLCELDDGSMRPGSASDLRLAGTPNSAMQFNSNGPLPPPSLLGHHPPDLVMLGASGMIPPPQQGPGPSMFSPPPLPPVSSAHLGVLHSLHIPNSSVPVPNMTPIDKLYSMQTSYFSNPSECEC